MTLTCAKDSVGVEYIPNDKEVLNKDMILARVMILTSLILRIL